MAATAPEPYAYITHRQEAFSEAYVRAVCAVVGCSVSRVGTDNDKIDLMVSSRVLGKVYTKPKIDMQLKCELTDPVSADPVPYSLDIETYNNLRDPLVSNPRILVVVHAPKSPDDWAVQNFDEMIIRRCAYWVSLKGADESKNISSQTVYLPKANILTPDALRKMMLQAANGEDLA